jgi:hypothetical protein
MGPFECAKGSFEREFVALAYRPIEKYLDSVPPHARRLAFRADFLPRVCGGLVKALYPSNGWALGLHNCYRLAGERTVLEYLHRGNELFQNPMSISERSIIQLYLNGPDNLIFWENRFNSWLEFTLRSWSLFIRKQTKAILTRASPAKYEGTILGIIARTVKPSSLDFATLLSPENISFFKKKAQPASWKRGSVDSWLMEVWPIVKQYCWTYHDLQKAISEIGELDSSEFFETPDRIKDRCKTVLRLHLSASAKKGRPYEPKFNGKVFYRPPLFVLATRLSPVTYCVDNLFSMAYGAQAFTAIPQCE